MSKLKNPFLLTGFYGREYFCDRETELETLFRHFENERNVVIYSWRRLGKTVLINYFLSLLEEKKSCETIYIDLLGTRDMASAIKQITQAVFDKYGKTSGGMSATIQQLLSKIGVEMSFDELTGTPKFSVGYRQPELAQQSLHAIGDFLASRKKQVLIALDEFQQTRQYTEENGEAEFRSWMQSYPGIRFIFSGSHRNMMLSMFAEKNRPFYRSAQLLELNPIEFEPYKNFIQDHFTGSTKKISEEAITQIYTWSRGQTYSVQLVCNKLFGMYNQVNDAAFRNVLEEIINQESGVFSNYTNLLTKTQWNVLLAIAKAEPLRNPLSNDFIQKHRLGAASTVSSAIKMLEKSELVIREDSQYLVHDVLLARWLQRL